MSRFWREQGCEVTALDLSAQMLDEARRQQAAHHYLAADIEAIPLAAARFDLAWSNGGAMVRRLARRAKRTVSRGASAAWWRLPRWRTDRCRNCVRRQAVDNRGHANHFLSPETIGNAMRGWRVRQQIRAITLWFDDALSAMRSLKGIGATHLHEGREPRVLTRSQLRQLQLARRSSRGNIR